MLTKHIHHVESAMPFNAMKILWDVCSLLP